MTWSNNNIQASEFNSRKRDMSDSEQVRALDATRPSITRRSTWVVCLRSCVAVDSMHIVDNNLTTRTNNRIRKNTDRKLIQDNRCKQHRTKNATLFVSCINKHESFLFKQFTLNSNSIHMCMSVCVCVCTVNTDQ